MKARNNLTLTLLFAASCCCIPFLSHSADTTKPKIPNSMERKKLEHFYNQLHEKKQLTAEEVEQKASTAGSLKQAYVQLSQLSYDEHRHLRPEQIELWTGREKQAHAELNKCQSMVRKQRMEQLKQESLIVFEKLQNPDLTETEKTAHFTKKYEIIHNLKLLAQAELAIEPDDIDVKKETQECIEQSMILGQLISILQKKAATTPASTPAHDDAQELKAQHKEILKQLSNQNITEEDRTALIQQRHTVAHALKLHYQEQKQLDRFDKEAYALEQQFGIDSVVAKMAPSSTQSASSASATSDHAVQPALEVTTVITPVMLSTTTLAQPAQTDVSSAATSTDTKLIEPKEDPATPEVTTVQNPTQKLEAQKEAATPDATNPHVRAQELITQHKEICNYLGNKEVANEDHKALLQQQHYQVAHALNQYYQEYKKVHPEDKTTDALAQQVMMESMIIRSYGSPLEQPASSATASSDAAKPAPEATQATPNSVVAQPTATVTTPKADAANVKLADAKKPAQSKTGCAFM